MSDLIIGQIYEHLLQTHIRMEPVCVQLERHLSKQHPLHQILQFHCRGLIPVNKNGIFKLLGDQQAIHRLYAGGNVGLMRVVQHGFKEMTWGDIGYEENIKVRVFKKSNIFNRICLSNCALPDRRR